MFGLALAVYSLIGLTAVTSLTTLVLKQRFPRLLLASCCLYLTAFLTLWLAAQASSNKLSGALTVLAFFPLALLQVIAGVACFITWIGQTIARNIRVGG